LQRLNREVAESLLSCCKVSKAGGYAGLLSTVMTRGQTA
jgi:hypothetical protein